MTGKLPIPILSPERVEAADLQTRSLLCALTVMAKAPRAGKVKTRLSPPLTPSQASDLNICFLRDTTENISLIAGAAGLISYTPVGDEAAFEGLLPESFVLIPQRGDTFGERLLAAAQDILACGYASVCLIDSDSPTVPQAAFEQAVAELARPGDRIVLGPTMDGGYYLIGLNHAHASIFDRISWSTATVFAETCERARESGIEVIELPLWYDVDDGPTLDILKAELLAGMAPGFATTTGYPAPTTKEFLMTRDLTAAPANQVATNPAAEYREE